MRSEIQKEFELLSKKVKENPRFINPDDFVYEPLEFESGAIKKRKTWYKRVDAEYVEEDQEYNSIW